MDTETLFKALPKAELHLHLRGAIPLDFLLEQTRDTPPRSLKQNVKPAHLQLFEQVPRIMTFLELEEVSLEDIQNLLVWSSLRDFLLTYLLTSYFVNSVDDFKRLIEGVVRYLERQGIVYAELTVSPRQYISDSFSAQEFCQTLKKSYSETVQVRWILDPVRDYGGLACQTHIESLLPFLPDSVVGLTLGGAEASHPTQDFIPLYHLARELGLGTSVHAGEACGPESVWEVIEHLNVDRIGHGVRAVEDQKLVAYLAEHSIPLEVCPLGNIQTGIYPNLDAHPIWQLFNQGLTLSLNTDDPTFFHTSFLKQLNELEQNLFKPTELIALLRNGFQNAFLSSAEKENYLKAFDTALADQGTST